MTLSKIFKAYDVRGIYPEAIDETLAQQIGVAAGRFLKSQIDPAEAQDPMRQNVVVGRDMRLSSPALAKALIKGLTASPANVIDVGMVDTSFIYFAVNHLGCCGGIQTTASHNPPNYNGFKFSGLHARPIGADTGLEQIKRIAATVDFDKENPASTGRIEQRDLWNDYKKHVRKFLKVGRPLKIVVDASNGMAGKFMPAIFEDVKELQIIPINYETSGKFVHEPNPLVPENMRLTQEAVKKHGADLGVCFDGDADRCMFTDEQGNLVAADILGARMAEHFLKLSPGSPIVHDLRASKALTEHIIACGGKPVRSRVGHVFMKKLMKENDAVFGAELSAHIYYRDNWYADSGAITFAAAVSILSAQAKPLSALLKPLQKYRSLGETNFHVEDKQAMMDAIKAKFGDSSGGGAKVDELDGVTIDAFDSTSGGGWWCNVRPSNTEPLLRLNLEAKNQATLDKIAGELQAMLGEPVKGH
ncbi:MAG: phosphomannomutase/phosphoglucomutase [Phycisphaerales bacterium]